MPSPVVPIRVEPVIAQAERAFLAVAKRGRENGVTLMRYGYALCTIHWSEPPGSGLEVGICSERIEASAAPPHRIISWICAHFKVTKRLSPQGAYVWLWIRFADAAEALDFLRQYHDVRVGLINLNALHHRGPKRTEAPPEVPAPIPSPAPLIEPDAATPAFAGDDGSASLLDRYRQAIGSTPDESEFGHLVQQQTGLDLIWDAVSRQHVPCCSLTGLEERSLLRITHIKPWAASTDRERMDLSNVLLLSAHIDAAFARGFVSFDNDGALLVSSEFREYCSLWGCPFLADGRLRHEPDARMQQYFRWHRGHVFRRAPSANIFMPDWLTKLSGAKHGAVSAPKRKTPEAQ